MSDSHDWIKHGSEFLHNIIRNDGVLGPNPDRAQRTLHEDVLNDVGALVGQMVDAKNSDEALVIGLRGLEVVEQKRFIMQNLMEALKSGQSLTTAVVRYHDIGLMTLDERVIDELRQSGESTTDSADKPAPFINAMLGLLKKVSYGLVGFIHDALATIGSLVGVKPIVGVTGLFPSISFEITAHEVDVYTIIDRLMAGQLSAMRRNGSGR